MSTEPTINASRLDLALWNLQKKGAQDGPIQSPASLARRYLALERAANRSIDDEVQTKLCEHSLHSLRLLSDVPSSDISDVSIKIAAALISQKQTNSDMDETIFAILSRALAELVILSNGPIPQTAEIEAMGEDDLEMQSVPISATSDRTAAK